MLEKFLDQKTLTEEIKDPQEKLKIFHGQVSQIETVLASKQHEKEIRNEIDETPSQQDTTEIVIAPA